MNFRPLALAALAVVALSMAGCTPHAGDKCDPSKDSSYLSTHSNNGKTVTTRLECRQTGINRHQWVKV